MLISIIYMCMLVMYIINIHMLTSKLVVLLFIYLQSFWNLSDRREQIFGRSIRLILGGPIARQCLFSLLLYFSQTAGTDDDLYLNILCPYQLQRNVVAHKIYKGCSSCIKKGGTSDSATNAEKRFKSDRKLVDPAETDRV